MEKDINIEDVSDFDLINEISARMLESEVLQNVSTSDLEDELSSRVDSTFTDIKDLDEEDLYHLLSKIKKHNHNTKKEIITNKLNKIPKTIPISGIIQLSCLIKYIPPASS